MTIPKAPPTVTIQAICTGDTPAQMMEKVESSIKLWAKEMNVWAASFWVSPDPVVNLSEGQAAYVKTASDVRAGQDGLLREYDEDLSGETVMVSGKPLPKEYSCENHATAVPCRQCDAEELSLPDWVPSGYHITQHFEGTNHAGVHPGSLEECAECSPTGPSRPEWLPGDAGKQIFDMRFRLEDNPHWKIENLITRWYNDWLAPLSEADTERQIGAAVAERDKAIQERDEALHDLESAAWGREVECKAKLAIRAERNDYQARLKATNGAWIEMSKKLDKAIKERDETTTVLTQTIEARDRMRNERNNERGRASSAEARAEDAEKKLHLFEEAGMDNVRRMERAEAKVAHILRYAERLGKGNDADRARAGEIRQTLDLAGEQ